jgi:hypothetical protein
VYEVVRARVLNVDGYFGESIDALGTPCATSDQKITAAMRQLSLGIAADGIVSMSSVLLPIGMQCG